MIVVAVTLASTLGTWRVYKRSTWNRLSLTHFLAQQGKSHSPLQDNSHRQTSISALIRFGYFICVHHQRIQNRSLSLSDMCWLSVLLMRSCRWYVSISIAMPWLTKPGRPCEYVTQSYQLHWYLPRTLARPCNYSDTYSEQVCWNHTLQTSTKYMQSVGDHHLPFSPRPTTKRTP
jgi:hypothetical protein